MLKSGWFHYWNVLYYMDKVGYWEFGHHSEPQALQAEYEDGPAGKVSVSGNTFV